MVVPRQQNATSTGPLSWGQKHGGVADRVFQVRMVGQGFARGGEYAFYRRFVKQTVEQQLTGQAGGTRKQDVLRRQVHANSPLIHSA